MSVIINNFNKSNVTRIRSIYLSSCHTSPRRKFGVKREKISIAPKRRSRQSDRFEDIVRSFEGAKKKGRISWKMAASDRRSNSIRQALTRASYPCLFVSTHNISYACRRTWIIFFRTNIRPDSAFITIKGARLSRDGIRSARLRARNPTRIFV